MARLLLLVFEDAVSFRGFLVEQRLDTDAAGFGAEMSAKSVCARESSSTSPLTAAGELASTDEFLFAGVEPFVAFSIVLARECFAAYCADEGSFVGVGAEVGAQVVGARESFRAQSALEGSGVFLDAFWFAWCCTGSLRIG
jgi:hypothetical protein